MLVSRSGHACDLECRWPGAAMVLAPLQSAGPVRPRGPPWLAAAPRAPRSRAADRAARTAAHTRGTRGDPEDPGALHQHHRIPAGRAHRSRVRRFRHVLQRPCLYKPEAEGAAGSLRRGTDGVERLRGLTGGFISLTAHVGNWELAGRLLAGQCARPTHVVVAPEEMKELERWVRRDGEGVHFVTRSRPTVSLELVAALRRGEVVAVQGDRALGSRGDTMISFFGRPAPFPMGPFLLASAVGVPLVPAFCLLTANNRYLVKVVEPFTVRRGDEEKAAQAWGSLLEDVIREHPTQWFNFFDIWRPFNR